MKLQTTPTKIMAFLFLAAIAQFASAQQNQLVVIDGAFSKNTEVTSKIPAGIPILRLSNNKNPWEAIRDELTNNRDIKVIHLFAEATYNELSMGGVVYTRENLANEWELAMLEGLYNGVNHQLLLYDCNLASNEEGMEFLRELGNSIYFNIAAPTQCVSILNDTVQFDFTTLNQPINSSILTN